MPIIANKARDSLKEGCREKKWKSTKAGVSEGRRLSAPGNGAEAVSADTDIMSTGCRYSFRPSSTPGNMAVKILGPRPPAYGLGANRDLAAARTEGVGRQSSHAICGAAAMTAGRKLAALSSGVLPLGTRLEDDFATGYQRSAGLALQHFHRRGVLLARRGHRRLPASGSAGRLSSRRVTDAELNGISFGARHGSQ